MRKAVPIRYQWMNEVPQNGDEKAIQVNYFCKKLLTTDPNGEERVYRTESGVTDLNVNSDNVMLFTRGAKSRWKIESVPQAHDGAREGNPARYAQAA